MRYVYLAPTLPKLSDPMWDGLAQVIKDTVGYWDEARRPLTQQWIECDRAYLCERDLPYLSTMDYIDSSDFGQADVHNAVNNFIIKLTLGLMDRKEKWLTVVGRADEPVSLIKQVKGEQAWMHRQAGSRAIYAKGLKQATVRGTTHWLLKWLTRYDYVPISDMRGMRAFARHLRARGEDPAIIRQIKKIREPKIGFNGPQPRVMDCFDVFLNPEQDIVNDFRPSYIYRDYVRPHILEGAEDEYGDDLYSNLDGLQASKAGDIYYSSDDATRRNRSLKIMGLNPSAKPVSAEVVPVYVYYAPHLEYEGYEFIDTYFHMALDANNTPRIIRIEENPSATGHDVLLTESFIEFFTNIAYGMGMVKTVLSALDQKNFLAALLLNAMAAGQAPPMLYASGALKYDFMDLTPSALNEVLMGMVDAVKPVPTNPAAVPMGIQDQEYLGGQINKTFEVAGGGSPAFEPSDRETATATNYKASTQGLAVEEQVEKFGNSLQKYCQWSYDERQARAIPDYERNGVEYIQYNDLDANGKPVPGEIVFEDYKRPRTIEIQGDHGSINKEQSAARMIDGMKAFGQFGQLMPNAPALGMEMMKQFFRDQEIETDEAVWMTPQELAAQDPMVQQMAFEQGMNNPEMWAQYLEKNPQVAAQFAQMSGKPHLSVVNGQGAPENGRGKQQLADNGSNPDRGGRPAAN